MKNNPILHTEEINNEKEFLMEYAWTVFDAHGGINFKTEDHVKNLEKNMPKLYFFMSLNLEKVSIRVFNKKGETMSLLLRRLKEKTEKELLEKIKELCQTVWQDKSDDLVISKETPDEYTILLDFLYNKNTLPNNSIYTYEKNFEKGLYTVEVENKVEEKYAIYMSSVIADHNYSLKRSLENVRGVAQMDVFDYYDSTVTLYENISFKKRRNEELEDVYRYTNLVLEDDMTKENIKTAIEKGKQWLTRHVNKNKNGIEYEYSPSWDHHLNTSSYEKPKYFRGVGFHFEWMHERDVLTDSFSPINKSIWSLESAYYLSEVNAYHFDTDLDNILKNVKVKLFEQYPFFTQTKERAYLLLFLLNTYPNKRTDSEKKRIKLLAEFLMEKQSFRGEFYSYIEPQNYESKWFDMGIIFLALTKYIEETADPAAIKSAMKTFEYLKENWEKQAIPSLVPNFTEGLFLLYLSTKKEEIADLIFAMNSWIIDDFQWTAESTPYPDKVGGFTFDQANPTISSAMYTTSLTHAIRLSESTNNHKMKLKLLSALQIAGRFIYQLHSSFKSANHLIRPAKIELIEGGFKNSIVDNKQNCIGTMQGILALSAINDLPLYTENAKDITNLLSTL